jgi:hypothetical protein
MKVKRLLAAAITAVVALTSVLPVSAIDYGKEYENKPSGTYDVKFKDVPRNNWAFEYIGEMQKRGIINGYPDGKYYPDNYVERCEFAKIMVGAAGLRTGDASGEYFADVKYNDWFYEYVETAKEYLTGYKSFGQNYFRPNNYALREDIAVALVKLKGYDTKNTNQNILQTMFSDYDSISESAKPYVATAVDRGLVSGYDDGTFKGQDSITRAEAAAMLWRAYQYGNDNKTTEVSDNSNNSQTLGDADTNKTDDTKNDKKTNTNTDKKTDTKKNANNTLTESKDDGKSYAVTTLAKATINDSLTDMTIDDNDTVYYINRKDNSLYKVAAKSGAGAKKLTSLSKLTYTETETRQETRTVKKKVEKVSSQSADEGAAIALAAVEDEDKSNDTSVTNNNESDKDKDDVTLDNGEMADDDKKDENLGEEDKDNQNETDDKKDSDSKDSADSDKSDSKDENTDKDTNKDADKDKDSEKPKEPEYEYIDVEETVDVEVPIAKYSDYYAQQVYYEPTSDKVWLIGYFKNKTNEQGQEGSDKFWMTLNANDLKEVIVKGSFEPDSGEPVIGSLPNGQIVTKYGNYRIYLINQDTWQRREFYIDNYANIWSAIQNGNSLFMLDGDYKKIYIYNFTSKSCDEYKTEFKLTADKLASGNNCFYFWNIKGGKIVAFNVKNERFKNFKIDAGKDIQLKDNGYITANGLAMMRVTSNENFVFADKDSAAIRLLYKK